MDPGLQTRPLLFWATRDMQKRKRSWLRNFRYLCLVKWLVTFEPPQYLYLSVFGDVSHVRITSHPKKIIQFSSACVSSHRADVNSQPNKLSMRRRRPLNATTELRHPASHPTWHSRYSPYILVDMDPLLTLTLTYQNWYRQAIYLDLKVHWILMTFFFRTCS